MILTSEYEPGPRSAGKLRGLAPSGAGRQL